MAKAAARFWKGAAAEPLPPGGAAASTCHVAFWGWHSSGIPSPLRSALVPLAMSQGSAMPFPLQSAWQASGMPFPSQSSAPSRRSQRSLRPLPSQSGVRFEH